MPRHLQLPCQAGGTAHQALGSYAWAQADQQRLAHGPYGFNGLLFAPRQHVGIDPVCGAAQGEFAQCNEVAFAKEVLHGALGLLRQIDFARFQAREQLIRGQIDQHHIISTVKQAIRHGFPHARACDAANYVIQTFKVLHVDGAVYIYARAQQLFYVLPAFGVAAAWGVGVRQLINQYELRLAFEGSI